MPFWYRFVIWLPLLSFLLCSINAAISGPCGLEFALFVLGDGRIGTARDLGGAIFKREGPLGAFRPEEIPSMAVERSEDILSQLEEQVRAFLCLVVSLRPWMAVRGPHGMNSD